MYEILSNVIKNKISFELIDKLNEKCDSHSLFDIYEFKCI